MCSLVPPQIKPNQKTTASHKPNEFLSCHLVRNGSQETLVGGTGYEQTVLLVLVMSASTLNIQLYLSN